jgi:hypothetical protein
MKGFGFLSSLGLGKPLFLGGQREREESGVYFQYDDVKCSEELGFE